MILDVIIANAICLALFCVGRRGYAALASRRRRRDRQWAPTANTATIAAVYGRYYSPETVAQGSASASVPLARLARLPSPNQGQCRYCGHFAMIHGAGRCHYHHGDPGGICDCTGFERADGQPVKFSEVRE